MKYRVRFTRAAKEDVQRLFGFLVERDPQDAQRAREAIGNALGFLGDFPFSCRKATTDDPFLREMVIPFGASGYVALFEIEDEETVTILTVRHQREEDYF